MLHCVLLSSLLVALSGCGDVLIGNPYMGDAGVDEGEESEGGTSSLDETLAGYANEVAGEWQVMSGDNAVPAKLILTPSAQPRSGTAELVSDTDAGRPRMMGPGDKLVGDYWFVKVEGANAIVIMDGPSFLDVFPSTGRCVYMPLMKKIQCPFVVFSRGQGSDR